MPLAPITISSQSRKKLRAFRFQPEKTDIQDKENAEPQHEMAENTNSEALTAYAKSTDPSNQRGPTSCPQTPGEKIPFSDLIANPEERVDKSISATPLDQIEWNSERGSSQPSASARSAQRRRKRARSSSPVSSSQPGKQTVQNGRKEPLDLECIGQSLRTPKHEDPLSLLWNNYAGARGQEEDDGLVLPPPPTGSSSPCTPPALKKDALRRTASCGIEWPATTSKKRKISERDMLSRTKGIFAAKKNAILAKNATNQSRVSILVDSIHQSLLEKASSGRDAPSSSSPLPERRAESQYLPTKEQISLQPIVEADEDSAVNPIEEEVQNENCSEYGDMDLDPNDPDLLNAIHQAATQQPVSPSMERTRDQAERSRTMSPDPAVRQRHTDERQASVDSRPEGGALQHRTVDFIDLCDDSDEPAEAQSTTSDDFDNMDEDDDFATELAELADKVDSQDMSTLNELHDIMKPTSLQERSKLSTTHDFDGVFDDDDDGDEIWTEIENRVDKPSRSGVGSLNQVVHDNRTIKRYLIRDVLESKFKNRQGRYQPEKTLSIKDEKNGRMYLVHLRQSWYDTRCMKGSFIHLVGDFDRYGSCIVDDQDNMVILHPDHLISATVVADSFSCARRAALQDRVKATAPAEPPVVYGHLIHEVFGEALRQNCWTSVKLREIVTKLIPSYIESLYEINVQIVDAIEYVMSKMPELTGWASVFVTGHLDSEATIRDRNDALVPMTIDKLLELEEHIWSPRYGLKGNVDATIQAQMQLPGERSSRTLTVPLELKTGKRDSNEMHRAQTALYTLLLSDRYDINVTSGILYYLETSKTFRVQGVRNEIRQMIIQRNDLACYVHDKLALPPMLKKEHLCKRCYAQTSCFTYHRLVENGDEESSGMKQLFSDAVGHLKESQQIFFKKWDDLLTKEERDAMKFKRELWTMLSSEREAVSRCFGNVVIEPGSAVENIEALKINRYTYAFVKQNPSPGFSFMESQITAGEPIVISDEKGHFALANGYVVNVRPLRITVAVDRRLQNARTRQPGFDQEKNQVFSAMMQVDGDKTHVAPRVGQVEAPILYRIDKDEFANGMATARNNIIRIMDKDLWRARELRQLIIENKTPVFKQIASAYTLSGPASQQNLNADQRKAIEKVMSARDYALVLGMPGTGKTTTIAHIIRALVAQGKSVLLTSYTHTAVDNILLKIKDDNIPVLRLGPTAKVHSDVAKFADLGGVPKKTIQELETSWTKNKVVATTCLGINHAIFNHRKFDYCIVDEASQITLPVCLGPIRLASTFILVGDHYQLPPLVQNKEAQEGGLDISLFKLLSDAQPCSVVNLEHQYRMAEDIMLLSNTLVYDGRLKCGTPSIASRTLNIPNLNAGLDAHHHSSSTASRLSQQTSICIRTSTPCWLSNALDPSHRAIFLNTDTMSPDSTLGAPETTSGHGTRITNVTEATLTAQMITTLIRSGVSPKNIGVITFYRSQLALLRTIVKSLAGTSAAGDLEMHTADKYQGRDKEVILLSCVRSNDTHHVGELLKDWRRVNVALTRAKSKLVMLGSLSTLGGCGVPVLQGLVEIVRSKDWVLNLPNGALDMHVFQGMQTTQTQTQSPVGGGGGGGRAGLDIEHSHRNAVRDRVDRRDPLSTVTPNPRPGGTGKGMGSEMKRPKKTVDGRQAVSVEKFLDRHPLVRDVVGEFV